jgi:valyl-tRNA synthetase
MPFVTEEIYQSIQHEKDSICISAWPEISEVPYCDMESMSRLISMIQRIREVKNVHGMKPSAPIHVMVKDLNGNIVKGDAVLSAMLAKTAKAEWTDDLSGDLSVETVSGGSIYIPSGELTNPEEEMKKLTAEKERLENELKRSEKMLSNPGFINKAPAAKIRQEKEKQDAYQKQYALILERISVLNDK